MSNLLERRWIDLDFASAQALKADHIPVTASSYVKAHLINVDPATLAAADDGKPVGYDDTSGTYIPISDIVIDTVVYNESYTVTGNEPIGSTFWDSGNHCLTTVYEFGTSLQHGFELYAVGTDEGNDFPEGSAISVKGSSGNKVAIELTDCSDNSSADNYIGLITSPVDGGHVRIVTREGAVRGINTTGAGSFTGLETWNEGDFLYVDPAHPGYLTNVLPGAPNRIIRVGTITNKHQTQGIIELDRFIYTNLTDSPDVNGTVPDTNGQFLVWDNDNSYFDFTHYVTTDGTLAANSDTNVPSEKAVKTYVGPYISELGPTGNLPLQNVIFPHEAGFGIKVDPDSPVFTYRDIIGAVLPDPAGANSPALTNFRGNVRGYQYTATDKLDCVYHIPHDYVPGTDLFLHLHWGHNSATISGNFVFNFEAMYASRQASAPFSVFGAPVSNNITVNALTIGNYPQYCHVVTEIQLSTSGGGAGLLDTDAIEVDGIVQLTFTYNGTMSADPFISTGDVHYLSSSIGTKGKDPDFYL